MQEVCDLSIFEGGKIFPYNNRFGRKLLHSWICSNLALPVQKEFLE